MMLYSYNGTANCDTDARITVQQTFPASEWECDNTDSCNILKYRQYASKPNVF
eukprot:UN05260